MISPMIRSNICLNAHPQGLEVVLDRQIAQVRGRGALARGPASVLVLGCSTGYGLAARTVAAFGAGAKTLGISYERQGSPTKSGTPGFYNNRHFERRAAEAGLVSETLDGDAFSDAMRHKAIELIRQKFGQIDMVIYSLASPVRVDPEGRTWKSSIKPIGQTYSGTLVDMISGKMSSTTVEPASEEEIQACVKVMGGEDWRLWIDALAKEGLLAPGAISLAFSYIGPSLSYPIYRSGTLGRAKEDLEACAHTLCREHAALGLKAFVSVNKALVTRASAVIPAIPLYVMALYKVMKAMGLHEGCLDQMDRLFRQRLYAPGGPEVDEAGRIRLDDWEMRAEVQAKVDQIMAVANEANLASVADLEGFRSDFLEAHGFGVEGVDYESPVNFA